MVSTLFLIFQLFCLCCFYVVQAKNTTITTGTKENNRISVFWTGFEAEDSTARLLKLIGLICVVTLTTSLVCCCLCSFRKSKKSRKWVLVERVGLNDNDFLMNEHHDNHGMQMSDMRDDRKQLAL